MGLWADLTQSLPDIPEPTTADGTVLGEPHPPPQEDLVSKVLSWWTGPWPELHSKIDETTTGGALIKAQAKADLLREMRIEYLTATDENNQNILTLGNDAGSIAIQLLIDNWYIFLGLLFVDFMWATACSCACVIPGWIPYAIALGIDWLVLYGWSIAVFECSLRNSGYSPNIRFWALIIAGAALAFGVLLFEIGVPVLRALLVHEDVSTKLLEKMPGAFIRVFIKMLGFLICVIYAVNTLRYG